MCVNRKDLINLSLFLVLITSDLFSRILPSYFAYVDELIALLLLMSILCNRRIDIKKYVAFIGLILLGILGNFVCKVVIDLNIILYDLFLFCKPYIFLMYTLNSRKKYKKTMAYHNGVSKMMLWILFFFSIITMLTPLGMLTDKETFRFFSSFDGTVACWSIVFLTIIWGDEKKFPWVYYIITSLVIVRTESGLGGLSMVLALLIYLFGQKQKKFKAYYLLLIIPICLFCAKGEIESYLLDINAPRALLYIYAFITANEFFPIGSGFASYGSSIAASHYSPLYLKYGFNMRWGMSIDYHPFLMDSYYPQIIAQFGYIGLIIFILMWLGIMRKYILKIKSIRKRFASIFLILSWFIAGIGFNVGSSWGCTVLFTLGMIFSNDKTEGSCEV